MHDTADTRSNAVAALLALLRDPAADRPDRRVAMQALKHLAPTRVAPVLAELVLNAAVDPSIRFDAAKLVQEMDEQEAGALLQALARDTALRLEVRNAAIARLGSDTLGEEAADFLLATAQDPGVEVALRLTASVTLSRQRHVPGKACLLALAQDPAIDAKVRFDAIASLRAQLLCDDEEALPLMLALVYLQEADGYVRKRAADTAEGWVERAAGYSDDDYYYDDDGDDGDDEGSRRKKRRKERPHEQELQQAFLHLARDKSVPPDARLEATLRLYRSPNKRAMADLLLDLAHDPAIAPAVRCSAVDHLSSMDSKHSASAVQLLLGWLVSPEGNEALRDKALTTLNSYSFSDRQDAQLQAQISAALLEVARDAQAPYAVRSRIVGKLERMEAVELIRALAEDPSGDARLRARAQNVLGRMQRAASA